MRPLFFENFTQVDVVILAVVAFNMKSTVVRTSDKQNAEYCKTCARPLVFFPSWQEFWPFVTWKERVHL